MNKQMTKEQIVFLVGAALFIWVMIKLGLFLTRQSGPPGTPMVAAATAQPGDSAIADFLAARGLDTYLGRGSRDFSVPDVSGPTQLFVRSFVAHSFLRRSLISSYTFDCRMSPNPVRELRFQIPEGLKIADVFSKEAEPDRKWGVDGRTLVVPINPELVKRAYYRCQLAVKVQGVVSPPTTWTAPLIVCGEATPNVQCEIGHVAIATPGDQVQLLAKELPQSLLQRVNLEAVPKELAASSNKLAYYFRQPNYTLTLDVKGGETTVVAHTKENPPPLKSTNPPPLKSTEPPPVKGTETATKEEGPTLTIPRAADAEGLPFKLAAIVRIDEPEPRRQAVLRDKNSGEYLRKFEGDTITDDLRVVAITDDAVIVADSKGKHYKFADRFEDKYNATTPATPPATKQGPPPAKKGPPPGKTKR